MAITAQELRVGNWLKAPLGELMKVKQIGHPENPEYVWGEGPEGFGANGFEGIPLTPAILEKAGFERHKDKKSPYYFREGLRYNVDTGMLSILRGCDKAGESQAGHCGTSLGDNVSVKYLHQLQNLYFALTSTELEINL